MGHIKFLKCGCGDATLIKDTESFLIDCNNMADWASELPTSKRLRGVFITHHHRDHYSGLQYLKEHNYYIDFLIYSPYERRYNDASLSYDEWDEFNKLRDHFIGKGTVTRTPYRQDFLGKPWWDCGDVKFWILGPQQTIATSNTREIHDACLVITVHCGKNVQAVVTGDASDINLNYVAKNTTNISNHILRASHHGSINGADLEFIKACNANYTVISTETGHFENVPHATALRRYSDNTKEKVYRTDEVGTITWSF